jgi:osmotically-inducible protein OsmY
LLAASANARTILIREAGRWFAKAAVMPTNQDLARKTVPDAATGFRDAHEPDDVLSTRSPDEQHLLTRVRQTLVNAGIDTEHLTIEVVQDRVNVSGLVADHDELVRVPDVIRDIEGVREVYDVLQVGELT